MKDVARLEVVRTNLAGALGGRLRGKVDVLIFNPPYVPTPSEEVGTDDIDAAWAGGIDGREVIDRLLPEVGALLSPPLRLLHTREGTVSGNEHRRCGGRFYMVLVEENRPSDVGRVLEVQGLVATCVVKRRAKNERLAVYRYEHHSAGSGGGSTTAHRPK